MWTAFHPSDDEEDRAPVKKYHAHDEKNEFSTGDMVWIEERRPISKLKCWEVIRGEKKQKVQ